MSGFGGVWPRVLAPVVEEARSLLHDFEAAEIPAALTRVAASQGGRLPPPLAMRLLDEIDRNEWFRNRVAEHYSGEEPEPGWLFLHRPDGWWVTLASAAAAAAAADATRRVEQLEGELQVLERKRSQAARRARELKKAAADAEKRSKRLLAEARGRAEGTSGDDSEAAARQADLAAASAALASLRLEHRELEAAFDALRARFVKMRRSRSIGSAGTASGSFVPPDPVKLARMLDLQSGAYGRDLTQPPAPAPTASALRLPPGVRPDSSDAIRWLLSLEQSVVVIVDGYNAQFHLDPADFTSGTARRKLIETLRRLRNAATTAHRIMVVFDSTLPGARAARSTLGGVEVRFAEDDRIADEEIVEAAAQLTDVVVISSDRAVRDGAEDEGAVVLWSEALVGWLGRS